MSEAITSTNFEEMLKNPEAEKLEALYDEMFGHIPAGHQRNEAIWNFGGENLIDFGDLCDTGEKRLFTDAERERFDETLEFERLANNEGAKYEGRRINKIQGRFLQEAMEARAAKTPPTPPSNERDLEAELIKMGYTARAAKGIIANGFKPKG